MMDYNYHHDYTGFADPNADKSVLKFPTGRYRLNLFHEFNTGGHVDTPPLYTMREEPWKGLPSAYLIYMTSESEYEAAMKLVGSWLHWKKLLGCKEFMQGPQGSAMGWEGLLHWREEKDVKDAAVAYQQLKSSADHGSVPAQRAIWDEKTKAKKGRPKKEDIIAAAKEAAESRTEIRDDLARIKLAVNNDSIK